MPTIKVINKTREPIVRSEAVINRYDNTIDPYFLVRGTISSNKVVTMTGA